MPFKIVLISMIVLHSFILKYMNTLPTDFKPRLNASNVSERLARIIERDTPVGFEDEDSNVRRGREDAEEAEEAAEMATFGLIVS